MTYRCSISIILIMWCSIIGGLKGKRVRYCTDDGLDFSISTVLQQHLHHLDMTPNAGNVQWCIVILWDDASA